jgi:hypothetical protein
LAGEDERRERREERGGRRGWTGGAASPFSAAATAELYRSEPKVS